jgi:hypothetical protein
VWKVVVSADSAATGHKSHKEERRRKEGGGDLDDDQSSDSSESSDSSLSRVPVCMASIGSLLASSTGYR